MTAISYFNASGATTHNGIHQLTKSRYITVTTATPHYFNESTAEGGTNTISLYGGTSYGDSEIFADNAYL